MRDNAAWLLYAAENGLESFDAMVPAAYKKGLTHRNSKVAVTYQVPYGMPVEERSGPRRQDILCSRSKPATPARRQKC